MTVVDTDYQADPDPALPNPERGIYYWPGIRTGYHALVAQWLYLGSASDQDLRWAGHGSAATSPLLDRYADALAAHRSAGTKVLFRPRYDVPGDDTLGASRGGRFHADTLARQLGHIDAIAAMLGEFRDVVAFIEAGYLGRWGEWNTYGYSASAAPLLSTPADRNAVIDHVLAAYAAAGVQQHVQLRRPVFAKEVLDRDPTARVGLHDDSFMTDEGDLDTYANVEPSNPSSFASLADAKAWARALTARAPFGGETCPFRGERWRSCEHMVGAQSEPAALHVCYLHGGYAADAKPTWVAGGCYDEIRRRLGYRFEILRVAYTPIVATGAPIEVHVDIANTGWARLHKAREAKLVLRSGQAVHVHEVASGAVASWEPGQATRLSLTAPAPNAGTYSVRLWIPDPDAPASIPYAVRLASLRGGANVFDAATGENDLGVAIVVP